MLRAVGSVVVGLICFAAMESVFGFFARSAWAAYAAAAPTRSYTVAMLAARLTTGAVLTIGAGYVASITAGGNRRSAALFGITLLTISSIWHYHIWDEYPVWYHLVFLGYLLPLVLLSGRLNKSAVKS
jgi:hypothetical protein